MSEKLYLSAQELLEDSFKLGAKIIEDGFRPTIIIAIWRGGTPMGIAIQELLAYFGVETDHIAIRTSSYTGIDGRSHAILDNFCTGITRRFIQTRCKNYRGWLSPNHYYCDLAWWYADGYRDPGATRLFRR